MFPDEPELVAEHEKLLDGYFKQRMDELRADNLAECRQQAYNTLNQLFAEVNS